MRMKFDPERIKNLCKPGDYGIFNPPMDAQVALDELCHYLLGPDWYDSSGCTNREQINTEIVCQIEKQYRGAVIRDENRYQRTMGRLQLCELPVATVFKLGPNYFKKIADHEVWGKISFAKPNAINLINGHRVVLLSSLWVNQIPITSIPKSGPETLFLTLRWVTNSDGTICAARRFLMQKFPKIGLRIPKKFLLISSIWLQAISA